MTEVGFSGNVDGPRRFVFFTRDGKKTNLTHPGLSRTPQSFRWMWGCKNQQDECLAYAILAAYLGEESADHLYQNFAIDVIANLPEPSWHLYGSEIICWISKRGHIPGDLWQDSWGRAGKLQ